MKQLSKKLLSTLLAVLMLVSVLPAGTMTAQAATNVTQKEAVQWANSQVNKRLDYDGYPVAQPYQCVDVAAFYLKYLGASSLIGGNASNYLNKSLPSGWKYVWSGYQPGDIALWPARVSYYYDDYGRLIYSGHIGVITESDSVGSNVVEQNYNWKYYVTKNWHRNTEFQCAIRPLWKTAIDYKVNTSNAGSINNENAKIGFSITNNGASNTYGFYISTNKSDVDNKKAKKYTVKSGGSNDKSATWEVSKYTGALKPNTTYYYKAWAKVGNTEKYGDKALSLKTTNNAPTQPKLTVAANSKDIGIGDSATVTWKASTYASKYTAVLYDENGNTVQRKDLNKAATMHTFDPINTAGRYFAYILASNSVKQNVQSTPVGEIWVHEDVTVTYVDADPSSFVDYTGVPDAKGDVIDTYTIHYGHNAPTPSSPVHKGYKFKGWDKSSKEITENVEIKAEYDINKYNVKFVDENGKVLHEEVVDYYSSPTAPSYTPSKTGYVFVAWDKDFEHIEDNTKITAVTDWYNKNYSVFTEITSAVRDETDKGYQIGITVTNNDNSLTTGRIVIALKTKEGKLLTSTESAAFSVKAGRTKTFDEFVRYDNPATKVYAYVVDDYKTMTPISQEASSDIDNGMEWTAWSEEMPEEGSYTDIKERNEYSYQTKDTTTSYATSLAGYTQNGYTLVKASSGTIEYASFPGGYNRNDGYYKKYANKTLKSNSETSTQKTTVSSSTIGYLYWHWSYPLSGSHSEGNRVISDTYNEYISGCGNATVWESFMNSSKLSWNSSASAYKATGHSTYSYWWVSWTYNNSAPLEVKRQTWTTYNKLYNYYKISDYCDWTTEMPSSYYGTLRERTVYSYKPKKEMTEDNTGVERTVSGKLDTAFAGKQATLYIYKVDEASDYSNEYIDQKVIGEDGSYSFTFKLREEPTEKTGDFTVALGLEGANSLIYLDPIIAPKPRYNVTFKDWDGTVLSEQVVTEGEDAVLPENELVRTGYHFTHWNNSNLNITQDTEITAEYEINTYTVVFVDWEARNVQIKEFEYRAELIAPEFESEDPSVNVVWDRIAAGQTEVTQNMVVCTEYTDKVYDVEFKGFDGETISQQKVTYGYAAEIPELDEDGKIFIGWEDTDLGELVDQYIVTSKISVCPRFVYDETCEAPVANVESGEYSEEQTITLTSATPDAAIYYTLDGSDPSGSTAKRYTAPITVSEYATLRCYAVALGKNNSNENKYLYVINPEKTISNYMRREDLPDYVVSHPEKYNVTEATGYIFKDTVNVTKAADYESYANADWQLESTDYSPWSEWQDEEITDDGSYISMDIETRDYEYKENVPSNKFERWTYYVDGEPVYANTEVDSFNGQWEYIEVPKTTSAKINGDYNGTFTYSVAGYEGSWFKPKTNNTGTIEVTKTKTQYRSRCLTVVLYKWTETPELTIDDNESREYQTVDLYRYEVLKHYIVDILPGRENEVFEDGTSVSMIFEDGAKLSAEDIPEPYGMTFDKLYKDIAHTQEWNLATDTVSENTTLYAGYTNKKYNVTFTYADGTEIETQSVEYMASANAPETIELPDGYIFLGWDNDEYKAVSKDTTVHARYVAEGEYSTVTFDINEVSVLAGTTAKIDAQTSIAGKTVVWTSSDEDIATVDEGTVKGVSEGKATIRATVAETGEYDECEVTVYRNVSTQVALVTNSSLKFDTSGYIRGIRVDGATVDEIKGEFANKPDNLSFKKIDDSTLEGEDKIGTGTTVSLMSNGKELDKAVFIITGDVNGDGDVNNRDIAMMNMYLVDKITPAEYQIFAMDVNGDGDINVKDAAALARYYVGKESL